MNEQMSSEQTADFRLVLFVTFRTNERYLLLHHALHEDQIQGISEGVSAQRLKNLKFRLILFLQRKHFFFLTFIIILITPGLNARRSPISHLFLTEFPSYWDWLWCPGLSYIEYIYIYIYIIYYRYYIYIYYIYLYLFIYLF